MRKELLEFMIELRRKGFVVSQHQRWTPDILNHLGHGVGFARACDAQQHLVLFAGIDTASQFINRASLVASGLIVAYEFEVHGKSSYCDIAEVIDSNG